MTTNTMVALKSTTLTSTQSSITFDLTGITGYTDLYIVLTGVGTTGTTFPWMRFNGLSTNIYSDTQLAGSGSSAVSARRTAQSRGYVAEQVEMGTSQTSVTEIHIMNYSNPASIYKTYLVRNNNAGSGTYLGTEAIVGMAQLSSPITSITFGTASGGTDYSFAAGTTATIYGIANADIGAYATGGVITQDANYYYHAFGNSSYFTPTRNLTADILVVAGGGGGGGVVGGGGGGGGLLAFASQSLFNGTAYTCTVGAGGAGGNTNNYGANGGNSSFGSISGTVYGGGGGAYNANTGANGGSGGGGAHNNNSTPKAGGTGVSGQGNAGGTGAGTLWPTSSSGGGGGATTVGADATSGVGGNGGTGYYSALTDAFGALNGIGQLSSGHYYFAGGGGGQGSSTAGTGGLGGGGAGGLGNNSQGGSSGLANTGGGGGGAAGATSSPNGVGGNGGSGLIIVRYAK